MAVCSEVRDTLCVCACVLTSATLQQQKTITQQKPVQNEQQKPTTTNKKRYIFYIMGKIEEEAWGHSDASGPNRHLHRSVSGYGHQKKKSHYQQWGANGDETATEEQEKQEEQHAQHRKRTSPHCWCTRRCLPSSSS